MKRVKIPRPLAQLASEPRIVLYDFDAWMNLWEYLNYRGTVSSVRKFSERMGHVLAALHTSRDQAPGVAAGAFGETLEPLIARAGSTLRSLPSGLDLVNRFGDCVERHKERSAHGRQPAVASIHGALDWDCIHYGADGGFYLYRFEKCRWADPGFDLGGFAADLLCFALACHDEETYRICRDELLAQYNLQAPHGMNAEDLDFYVVLALCERFQSTTCQSRIGELIAALNAILARAPLASCS